MTSTSSHIVRIGCSQWQMRSLKTLDALQSALKTVVADFSRYGCDLLLLPELFSLPLLAAQPLPSGVRAIHTLAAQTPAIIKTCTQLASTHHINIVTGSLPVLENGQLYNVSFFCHRDGRTPDTQYKLHPTPYEKQQWNMQGGDRLNVIDSDIGKIGILICYDVEFPELARLLADQGMQILCVPFWTDSQPGYFRVRYCAQARAIENECYVALAGSCGQVPSLDVIDTQHAQSAIFSPSDLPFPEDAILAETQPNIEMPLVTDLDLDKLAVLREAGAVQNRKDRRRDLYSVLWTGKK